MKPADWREWLIASFTQRYQSSADLALRDYLFSSSLFHSITPEQVEFMVEHNLEVIE